MSPPVAGLMVRAMQQAWPLSNYFFGRLKSWGIFSPIDIPEGKLFDHLSKMGTAMAPEDPYCSICIFSLEGGIPDQGSRTCSRCSLKARRANFVSIYRDGRRPNVTSPPKRKRTQEAIPSKYRENGRITSIIEEASNKTRSCSRSVHKKRIETWDRLMIRART